MKISKALFSFIGLMGGIVLIALSCGGGGGDTNTNAINKLTSTGVRGIDSA